MALRYAVVLVTGKITLCIACSLQGVNSPTADNVIIDIPLVNDEENPASNEQLEEGVGHNFREKVCTELLLI